MKNIVFYTGLTALVLLMAVGAWSSDLSVYYDYESISGGTIPDMSGHGHDGTINGVIVLAGGVRGNAAQFATGSFLDLDGANFPADCIPTSAFTLCAWVKCENTGGDHAVFNARASDETWLIHPDIRGGGQYRFCLRGDGSNKICDMKAGTVVWDEWIHYAGTYSQAGGMAILYINGEVIGEEIQANVDIAGDWGLGARVGYNIDNARPFTGLMDDFCIYKKALSQDEIQALMEGGPPEVVAVSPQGKLAATWADIKQ